MFDINGSSVYHKFFMERFFSSSSHFKGAIENISLRVNIVESAVESNGVRFLEINCDRV